MAYRGLRVTLCLFQLTADQSPRKHTRGHTQCLWDSERVEWKCKITQIHYIYYKLTLYRRGFTVFSFWKNYVNFFGIFFIFININWLIIPDSFKITAIIKQLNNEQSSLYGGRWFRICTGHRHFIWTFYFYFLITFKTHP